MAAKRVCILTAGQLSTCPRMLKAADALAAAGYAVRVVSARFVDWATAADAAVRATRTWPWQVVDYRRRQAPLRWSFTALRYHLARRRVARLGPDRAPLDLVVKACARIHDELVSAALADPADLFYGGTSGAIAAVADAGHRTGTPYALDLEDLHSGEHDGDGPGRFDDALALRIESGILRGAAFLTAGSAAIAGEYARRHAVAPVPIHNTFPLPAVEPSAPAPAPDGALRLYWFSQTIGPGRGLEMVVRAAAGARLSVVVRLRGQAQPGWMAGFRSLVAAAPGLRLEIEPPGAPDRMMELCQDSDAGLSIETDTCLNRRLCLGNKPLTYILAGRPVVLNDTPGHRDLATDLGEGVLLASGEAALAGGLRRWAEDPAALGRARQAAWSAARRRWHWEHPLERGALLGAVARVLCP